MMVNNKVEIPTAKFAVQLSQLCLVALIVDLFVYLPISGIVPLHISTLFPNILVDLVLRQL